MARLIPLWKLVGGAAVHCVVPAYLVALGVDGWAGSAGGAQGWLAQVPGFSAWFLAIYGGLGAGATAIAALAEPLMRHPESGEAIAANHLREALGKGRGAFGAQADAALDRIAASCPDLGDAAVRALVRDLAGMVAAGRDAVRHDPDIAALSAEAIERIAGEIERHASAHAEQAGDKARIIAAYVEQRYGPDGL